MLAVTTTSCPSSEKGVRRLSRIRSGKVRIVVRGFDVVDQADELVSADPGDGVCLAHAGFQPATDGDQELIPHLVAQAIVDMLEAVDVEEQDAEPRFRPSFRPRDGLAQTVAGEVRGWEDRSTSRGTRRAAGGTRPLFSG